MESSSTLIQGENDWISAGFASSIISYLEKHGYPIESHLREMGLSLSSFDESEGRIDALSYNRLFNEAELLSKDDLLGFRIGQTIKVGNYGVLGYLMMNCETLGEALLEAKKFQDLVGSLEYAHIEVVGQRIECIWQPNPVASNRHVVELNLAAIVTLVRWILGSKLSPIEVHFTHKPPTSLNEHQEFYKCPIQYNSDKNSISFPVEYMHLELPLTDKGIKLAMKERAEQLLNKRNAGEALSQQVTRFLMSFEVKTTPTIDKVAESFNLSVRSLQRELKKEGYSFKLIIDQVKKDFAIRALTNKSTCIKELSYELGFSDQSSFHRAFKRWTGLPPKEFQDTFV